MKKEVVKSALGLSLVFLGLFGYLFLTSSCGGGGGSSGNTGGNQQTAVNPDHTKYLKSVTQKVYTPAVEAFVDKATTLKEKVLLLESEITANGGDGGAFKVDAQNAWVDATNAWEALELMQVGPIGSKTVVAGGKGYRDEIYSWPTSSPCAVDQELVKNLFTGDNYLKTKLINVYGLDALEYLLFTDSFENQCSSQSEINFSGSWAALLQDEISKRRAQYAKVLAEKIETDAKSLQADWDVFASTLIGAGTNKTYFKTTSEALDAVFAGLFYIDVKTKDKKIALPFGLGVNGSGSFQAKELEFDFKDINKNAVLLNLQSFKKIIQGGQESDYGIDDLLVAKNATSAATELLSQYEKTFTALNALPEFQTIVNGNDKTAITSFYTELQKLTTLVKSDLVLTLNFNLPVEGAGDND